jgi:agmatine/peptidylarginine deiminase
MTDKEKELFKNCIPPQTGSEFTSPPPTPLRTMAEWEEVQGIMIAWTSYSSILRQIVDYAQDEGLVYIVCSDSNTVRTYLTNGGVPLLNLKFIIVSFNSVWCRDYGPWAAYSGISDSLKIVDWIYNRPRPLDDQVPVAVANYIGAPIYQAVTSPNNLTHTGGNFMVDGHGTGFSSKLILTENSTKSETQIDNIMNAYMGISRYIKMETLPYDQIHHIDMHMKLLDEETLLVGQYPSGVADGPQIEANLQYVLNNFQTCFGRPYKVVRIPMPPSTSGQYPPSANYFTYTNSVFVNKTVLVPIYGLSRDTTALRIYRENLPGYRIVGINSSSMISALGAIHCITKEIGVKEPVFISHAKILTVNTAAPYEVKAFIKTKSGISSAKVYWRTDTTQSYNPVDMTQSLDTFRADIPPQMFGTNIYYYISATSVSGRTVTKPITAPGGYIKFTADNPAYVPPLDLNIKLLFEGMYSPSIDKLVRKDSVTAYLHQSAPPFNIIDSAKTSIDSLTFTGLFKFLNTPTGTYYISARHFNSIETWSKSGGELLVNDGTTYNYDFTGAGSQAYGNNLILKGSKFCMYSGDINQDGSIDLSDVVSIYNDASDFISGRFMTTDLTGDGFVDLNDVTMCFNNSSGFVGVIRP